jgi:2-polyprenyl-3-methyl-5-hydroxy-6-metoxy-1,4-benzoquinol methylase
MRSWNFFRGYSLWAVSPLLQAKHAVRPEIGEDSPVIDETKVAAFAGKLVNMLNSGALALMTSVGHRTGLFDAMSGQVPATSVEIAEGAKLDERYVREWLGAMVTGGVVLYSPETDCYELPAEHAACLTRGAAPNLAAKAQFIGLLASVEDGVVDCFRNGGGVPYSAYPRFQEVMAEDTEQIILPALVDRIIPMAPGLAERLQRGIDVLDIGCGYGSAMNLLAAEMPSSRFTGYDLSTEGIAAARRESEEKGLANTTFEAVDLLELDEPGRYDLITAFDVIHDQVKPAEVLRHVHRTLKPDGVFLMVDIQGSRHVEKNMAHPLGTILYTVSTMHCMTISLAEGGAGLGTMWGEETAERMLLEAGFTSIEKHRLPRDLRNVYYVVRK